MPEKFRMIKYCAGLLLLLNSSMVNAQLLHDTATLSMVKQEVNLIYNLEFNQSREIYQKISNKYPAHPVLLLLRGITNYWENYPLLYSSPSYPQFEEDLRQCIKLSENNNAPELEAEFLLTNMCARGMLLMFYSDNDLIKDVIPLTTSTYKYLRRSFDFTSECADLFYFTGLYNYYREAYPKIYPVYESLAILFPSGDMDAGLAELKTAAARSIVLRAESYSLLTWIYLNFENAYPEALFYSKDLHNLYPNNETFLSHYIKNMLLMKQYDEAEKLITESSAKSLNRYFQAQLLIFKGILQEKKYLNNTMAEQYYNKGISDITMFGEYGNEYAAYAYFGLSRISEANGERNNHKIFRKEATKLAEFKKINFDK